MTISSTLPAAPASDPDGRSSDRGRSTLLALDLATTTGWALRSTSGQIISGTVSFRPSRYDGGGIRYLRFRSWLNSMAADVGGIGVVHHEEIRRHLSTDAAHVHGGLLATLTAWCEQNTIPYQGVPVGTIKALHRRQGQRRQAGRDRGGPRPRVLPRRRQRGRRARHPAVGDRNPRRRAMSRQRLPDRRAAETVQLEHGGTRFMVTIGFYPDGRPGEVFVHGVRTGSSLDALLADACVVISCLMQHGVEPRELAYSMGRLGNAEPASIIGAVIDLAAAATPGARTSMEVGQ